MTSTSVPEDPKSRLNRVSPGHRPRQRGGRPSNVDEPAGSRALDRREHTVLAVRPIVDGRSRVPAG